MHVFVVIFYYNNWYYFLTKLGYLTFLFHLLVLSLSLLVSFVSRAHGDHSLTMGLGDPGRTGGVGKGVKRHFTVGFAERRCVKYSASQLTLVAEGGKPERRASLSEVTFSVGFSLLIKISAIDMTWFPRGLGPANRI